MNTWTETEIQFLRDNNHLSYFELALKLGRSKDQVRLQFRKLKIKKIKAPHLKYTLNELFFQIWTDDMAYILGFAFADGSIRIRRGNSTRLRLCNTDENLLRKMRKAMKSNHPIVVDKRTGTDYYLDITRVRLVEDIQKLGMTENNSRTMEFPEIPNQYFFSFVRGYFDGDGHVKLEGKTGRKIRIIFTSGSRIFLTDLRSKFEQRGIKCSMRTLTSCKNDYYQLSILKKGRRIFYHGLYSSNPLNFKGIKIESKYDILTTYYEINIKINCEDCGVMIEKKAHNHTLCSQCSRERDRARKRKPDGYKGRQGTCADCSRLFTKRSHNHIRCKECAIIKEKLDKRKNYLKNKRAILTKLLELRLNK